MTPATASHAAGWGQGIMSVTRPALIYYGSKWRIAPWVISQFPSHRVYVEPFGGSGSCLLRKPRSKVEVYNDLKSDLVNLFAVLRNRDQASRLLELLHLTPYAYDEYLLSMEPSEDPVEMARRIVVRSFMSVGSDATNRRDGGGFRCYTGEKVGVIPAHQWLTLPDALSGIVERLQGVIIENRDALYVVSKYDSPETLHYIDPPYPMSTRGVSPGTYQFDMADDDHRELARVLKGLKGQTVISGYACDLYDLELYPDWRRVERRTLNMKSQECIEVLWISPNAITRPQLFALDA